MLFIYSDLPVPLWEYFLAEIHLLIAASERKKLSPRKIVANLQVCLLELTHMFQSATQTWQFLSGSILMEG